MNSFPWTLIPMLMGTRHKRHDKAARFLTGGRSPWLNTSTLMTAAGLAVGAYEIYRTSRPAQSTSTVVSDSPRTVTSSTTVVPDLPRGAAASAPAGSSADATRLARLALSAARADGTFAEEEYARVLGEARKLGVEPVVIAEFSTSRPLAEIAAGFDGARQKEDAYILAFTIVRADEDVSGAERIYLAQLASALGLDAPTVARLEKEVAARIDAQE